MALESYYCCSAVLYRAGYSSIFVSLQLKCDNISSTVLIFTVLQISAEDSKLQFAKPSWSHGHYCTSLLNLLLS